MLRLVTGLALLFSVAHFAWSGVRIPLDHPNLGKFYEEATPLREHLRSGQPVHSPNPAQYGPVFFFVMHPLLMVEPSDTTLAAWLYAIQLACIAASFFLTCAALKPMTTVHRDGWPLVVAWLAVLWLNFAPLYTVIALKSVESWELLLITLGLYAYLRARHAAGGPEGPPLRGWSVLGLYAQLRAKHAAGGSEEPRPHGWSVRGWYWTAALALAAAGLIKVLPFAFLYYWLVTDRRAFAYAAAASVALLLVGHVLYGPEMGLWYLPRVVGVAAGASYGLDWHENISLKAAFAKLFGDLPQPTTDAARTSGYFIALTGWRKTAAIALGDACVLAAVAGLTWIWLRGPRTRSWQRTLWEWSMLTVALLVLSPNTVFEYLTIALAAISYAFLRLVTIPRRDVAAWSSFVGGVLLMGGLLPRQWLNRLVMIERLQRWTSSTHLTPSEAFQYYCFPLIGLLLMLVAIWRLAPADREDVA